MQQYSSDVILKKHSESNDKSESWHLSKHRKLKKMDVNDIFIRLHTIHVRVWYISLHLP